MARFEPICREIARGLVRVTGYDTVMPYYRNEQYYLPQVEDIVTAVEQVIAL